MDKIKIGVITTSDRASQGIYDDISGVAIIDTMNFNNRYSRFYRVTFGKEIGRER